jgi:hypothetical protein
VRQCADLFWRGKEFDLGNEFHLLKGYTMTVTSTVTNGDGIPPLGLKPRGFLPTFL